MKDSNKKIFLIGIGMIIILLINFFVPNLLSNYKEIILLIASLALVKFLVGIDLKRDSNDKRVIRNVLIFVFAYYIITYLAGLFIGFYRTIYSYSLTNLTKNIIPTLIIIVLSEIIRNQMIKKSNKDLKINILTFFVFSLLEISVNFKYYNFSISDDVYQYFGLIVIGSVAKNILLTIINNKTDVYPGIIYRILMEEVTFLVLIAPDLGPYIRSVLLIVIPLFISVMLVSFDKKQVQEKPKLRKKHNIIYLITISILLVLVLLNTGFLKYQIMVVGSNSMKDYMAKGDVIFVERLKNDERKTVQMGEILVYKYDNKIISHRVIKILKRDKEIYYKTKGDSNDQEDGVVIDKEAVIGKVVFRIKYIGLPSVWLNDLFS